MNTIAASLSRNIDIIIARLPTLIQAKKQGHTITNHYERAIKHITQLTHSLYTTQATNVGYILTKPRAPNSNRTSKNG